MRKTTNFNAGWHFTKKDETTAVNLPHTWNAEDGQDGGNDYYRGACTYKKTFARPETGGEVWLEFGAAALAASVAVNGKICGVHKGGYSLFRANITAALQNGENEVVVTVDNSFTREVYPQKADFTFYGGIYRDVNLICVPKAHFALGYHGGGGIKITPVVDGSRAAIAIETTFENTPDGTPVTVSVGDITTVCHVQNNTAKAELILENVTLWTLENPHLYTATAAIEGDGVSARFGCRTIFFDKDGLLLNGVRTPLVGAARHQDRQGCGSAITREMMAEDMAIMKEMGANTVRLAHYQHDQYFYDLCDENGLIVWAEIPYISEYMPEGDANAEAQMTDLIVQCYNHPSIVCWGISNEITASGGSDACTAHHKKMQALCHALDASRPTTMAHVFMLDTKDELVLVPDICSYNLYFGWYVGELNDNDSWFDEFRALHPNVTIGLSEYGADANPAYQSERPEKGDWSESYQAVYHEHMLKMWSERKWIWAMHCWNMFDFGADGRNEGGKPGQNQKGLVTFDRKLKKDAFYIYKAYLSKDPFVHLCGSRYIDREHAETEIKVYSNQAEVSLYVDGQLFATKQGDKIFKFMVPISGEHEITATSSDLKDTIKIRKVEKANLAYRSGGEEVVNWFDRPDMQLKDGYYSIKDSMESLKQNPQAAALLARIMAKASASYGDVAKNVKMPEAIQKQMDKMPLESLLKQAGQAITPEMVVGLNQALSQIKKQ